jgi:hypothetical protein
MDESTPRLSFLNRQLVRTCTTILLAIFALSSGSVAHAQDDNTDAIAKATQLNKDAIAAYQAHKTDDAKRLLKQALDLCDASGLDQHPIKARTLVHFGMVLIGGSKQRDLGIKQFKKAMALEPEIGLTKSIATPEMQSALDEARKSGPAPVEAKSDAKATAPDTDATPAADETPSGSDDNATAAAPEPPAPPPPPPPPPPAVEAEPSGGPAVSSAGLDHEPVTRARPNTAIPITVNVEQGLKFEKLVLAYRPNGANDYLGREMKQVDPGIYSAEIPARSTNGKLVAYYIEAQDKNGDPVAARGSADKPLVIMLGEARVAKKEPSKGDDDGDDDDDDDDENAARFFVGLQIGSGVGYAKGNGDNDSGTPYSSGGVATAQAAHLAPEFGYWLRPDFMLSVQIRYQLVTGTTEFIDPTGHVHQGINYAFAAFAKATWAFGHGRLKPIVSLALGGGQIRHVVKNAMYHDCGADKATDCVDTIAAGPILAGGGAGILYSLTPRIAFLAVANTEIGAPDFTINLDANIGAAYQF